MDVIPAIDLLALKVVRLLRGRYDAVTVYSEDPVGVARSFRESARRLHLVDLEGARDGRPVQAEMVKAVIAAFGSGVQVGGGVRSYQALSQYFELGAERVVLGTAALSDRALLERAAQAYPGRVIVAVDAEGGQVMTDGWLQASGIRAIDLVKELSRLPLAAVLYTDIERDGTEVGPNLDETARLARETRVPVIASGGVGTLAHLSALSRADPGIVGAIVGRALHEGRFSIEEAVRAAALGEAS